jgi:methylglyoxal synthase
MAKTAPPDERHVYLALKNVFCGENAKLRKEKTIKQKVKKFIQGGDVQTQALVAEHNLDKVCHTAKTLLQEQIFESTLRAKMRFPEVFEVSPAQTAERAISEAEAVRSDSHAIRAVVEGHFGKSISSQGDPSGVAVDVKATEPGWFAQKHPINNP